MQIVPRGSQQEQAKIAALAAQGKLWLAWDKQRKVIRVLFAKPASKSSRE